MDTFRQFKREVTLAGTCFLLLFSRGFASAPDISGLSGGILVQVGGNGSLLRQFGTNEAFFAIGLDTNTANVVSLRQTLRDEGFSGQVLVDEWNGTDLPFIDNFVNALVLSEPCNVSSAEVARVLVPNGVAYRLQGTNWVSEVKPRPAEMDEWTHWNYSAANNRCSHDLLVGPLRRMQWYAGPFWTKYHFSSPAVQFVVSGGGRIFYVMDESPASTAGGGFPEKFALIARDAFNGKLLWRRPMGAWGVAMFNYPYFMDGGPLNPAVTTLQQRRFAVAGNRFYGVLDYNGPVVEMDGATGETVRTFTGTETCKELYIHNNRLYIFKTGDPELLVYDCATGGTVWSNTAYNPSEIAIYSNQLCILNSSGIHAVDTTTFTEQWVSSGTMPGSGFLIHAGRVLIGKNSSNWLVYDAANGHYLWSSPIAVTSRSGSSTTKPDQIFATTNLVWTFKDDMNVVGLDPLTGTIQTVANATNVFYSDHHHRCHDDRATDRFFIAAQEGIDLVSLAGGTNQISNWTRGPCNVGAIPANGLIYAPPAACTCVIGSMLHGFYTYAAPAPDAGRLYADNQRLVTGAAFGQVSGYAPATNDWAQYRYDSKRKSATGVFMSKTMTSIWSASLGGDLTPPVIAEGRLFVANRTDQELYALDAATGALLWKYAAGGEIDSPPSVWGGCVIFGCGDGRVYCLRAADGALVWRFQAAPRDCRNMQLENISSVWPVSGSVMVDNGSVYFAAGNSSRLDGGLWLYRLDAVTGAIRNTNRLSHVSPAVPAPQNINGADEEGVKNDLLVSDGTQIFLREAVYTSNLVTTTTTRTDHLFSGANRLLDSSWHHRQYWAYNTIFAQYLCVDSQNVYGIKAYTGYDRFDPLWDRYAPGSGYILFAQNISNKAATPIPESGVENEARPQPMTQNLWWKRVPLRVQAMVRAGDYLFVSGPPDVFNRADPFAAFEGRAGGSLWTVSPTNGERLADYTLTSPPVYDGMAAANNRLYISTMDGKILCLGQPESAPAASASVQPVSGTTSTLFTFDGTGSQDLDGSIVAYEWRVNGSLVSTNPVYMTAFGTVGARTVQLTVRDDDGMKGFGTAALSVTSPATDSDGDGLPDTWEIAQAGNLTTMNATSDSDADGLTDLQEYAYGTNPSAKDTDADGLADNLEVIAGTDPTSADSILQLSGHPLNGNQMQITWDSVSNRTYSIWGSTNLASGLTELVAHHITATPPVNTFTDTAVHNGVYFYQLQVTQNSPVPPPNAAPSVRNDEAYTTTNKAVVINVLTNDSDPDFQLLTITGVTQGAHGAVSFTTANVTYTPQSSWTGGTDTFNYTVSDSLGATASGQVTVYVQTGGNLVVDPLMKQAHPDTATITTAQAGAGWYVGTKRAWQWDRDNEWSYAFCGSEAQHRVMAQVIYDNSTTKGPGTIQFKATHQGTGNTLKVKVYGASSFSQAMTSETGSGTLLYDSENIATTNFDWKSFSGTVNFGTGCSYYLVLVWTDGIVPDTGEFMAVDNFYLGL
jgi:outer membrane protein assembly factor BamB